MLSFMPMKGKTWQSKGTYQYFFVNLWRLCWNIALNFLKVTIPFLRIYILKHFFGKTSSSL